MRTSLARSSRLERAQTPLLRPKVSVRRPVSVNAAPEPCIIMSNDDGVDSELARTLKAELENTFGYRVLFVGPSSNQSAASNRISLRKNMALTPRKEFGRDVYSLDGSPADCMLVTLDKGIGLCTALNLHPVLMISGPNYGANLSIDCLYSGTMAAARTAASMGVPSLAASSTSTDKGEDHSSTVEATLQIAEVALKALNGRPAFNWPRSYFPIPSRGRRFVPGKVEYQPHVEDWQNDVQAVRRLLFDAFTEGDVFLSTNTPTREWRRAGRQFRTTGLGLMFYRDVLKTLTGEGVAPDVRSMQISFDQNSDEEANDLFGRSLPLVGQATDFSGPVDVPAGYINAFGRIMAEDVEGSDLEAIMKGVTAVTPLQTWPDGHPLGLRDSIMSAAFDQDASGLPLWLTENLPVSSGKFSNGNGH